MRYTSVHTMLKKKKMLLSLTYQPSPSFDFTVQTKLIVALSLKKTRFVLMAMRLQQCYKACETQRSAVRLYRYALFGRYHTPALDIKMNKESLLNT